MNIKYQVRLVVEEVTENKGSDFCILLDTLKEFNSELFETENESIQLATKLRNEGNLDY